MTTNIVIQSVPHSGTRFVSKFFYLLGFNQLERLDNLIEAKPNSKQYCVSHFSGLGAPSRVPASARVVVPLRDPHLVAISNARGMFDETFGMPPESLNNSYNIFIKRTLTRHHVYLDIDCPKEKRFSHLVSVLKQLGVYEDSDLPIITKYADVWKPVGVNDNEWKQTYLETGALPDCIRRCDLQRIVNWHNKVKQECIYDYIA